MTILALNWIDWDPNFGLSDMISILATFLTLVAIFISSKAATSAKESAEIAKQSTEYIKKQTELMEEDLIHTHLPKLLPIPIEASIPLVEIKEDFTKTNLYGESNALRIEIINVSQSNTYMVSAWLEIELDDMQKYIHLSRSSDYYNSLHKNGYEFEVYADNEPKVLITKNIVNNRTQGIAVNNIHFKKIHSENILRGNETKKVVIPNYVYRILMHILYNDCEPGDCGDDTYKNLIKLVVKYKLGSQLDSNEFMHRKYALSIVKHKYFIIDYSKNTKKSKDKIDEFKFSVEFNYIEDIPIKDTTVNSVSQ